MRLKTAISTLGHVAESITAGATAASGMSSMSVTLILDKLQLILQEIAKIKTLLEKIKQSGD